MPQWSCREGLSLSQTTVNHDGYIWAHATAALMKLSMKMSKPNNMPEMRYEGKCDAVLKRTLSFSDFFVSLKDIY